MVEKFQLKGGICEPSSDISELGGNSSSSMAHELSTYVNYGGFKW